VVNQIAGRAPRGVPATCCSSFLRPATTYWYSATASGEAQDTGGADHRDDRSRLAHIHPRDRRADVDRADRFVTCPAAVFHSYRHPLVRDLASASCWACLASIGAALPKVHPPVMGVHCRRCRLLLVLIRPAGYRVAAGRVVLAYWCRRRPGAVGGP
jgi:hypothetical protein